MRNPYFNTPPVVKNLIIANCVIYLAVTLIPQVGLFCAKHLLLYMCDSPLFHSYQYVTSLFLHIDIDEQALQYGKILVNGGDFWHLFSNMFALWMFGRTLEFEIG